MSKTTMSGVRRFEFPPLTPFGAVMKAIVAALQDEGLRLTDANTRDRVTTVLIGGRKIAIVPLSRIGEAR